MKIVVTGALGHIGSRLIRDMPAFFPGVEIIMLDNMMTQRYCSLFNLPKEGNYRFIEADVRAVDLQPIFSGADTVVHLAALTDASRSFDQPEEMEMINFAATKRVAEACAQEGVALIHASSTSIYGTHKDQIDEACGMEDINPQSPYAETKLKEELFVADLCKNGELEAMTFRFGTIFGKSQGMRFHTAVNKFCWQAVMRQPLTVWETAYHQRRPYLDLGDAVRAISFIIKNNLFDGKVYNAVTVNATVCEVIDQIRLLIPEVTVTFVESRIMNQLSYMVLNTRLLKSGFQMQGDLGDSVASTVNLIKNAKQGC